jgi:hypothetical protein
MGTVCQVINYKGFVYNEIDDGRSNARVQDEANDSDVTAPF